MLAWSENAIAADASMGPLFSERELGEFLKYPPSSRKRKIKQRFIERISMPPYSTMSGYDKYKYIEEQIKPIKNNKGCFGGGCFGMILGGFISAAIGGPAGSILFLFIIAGGAYIGDQTTKPKQALILPLLELELAKNKPQYLEEVEARKAIASKNAKAAEVEFKNKREKAETESKRIFEMIQKEPKRIAELFPSYREYAVIVINNAHPNQDEVNAAASAKEFGNTMMAGLFGIYGDSYIPSNDPRFTNLIQVLEQERSRIKELVHAGARLTFGAIEHFQESSRAYYGLHREGGNASIYDEQLIQNEVMAMKETLNISGNYNDHSLRIDRSTTNTTNIQSAVIDNGDYSEERIKKEIMKLVLSSNDEASSRAELIANIPVKESQLLAALEKLQESGMLQIGNRPSGEIVYKLDRLA